MRQELYRRFGKYGLGEENPGKRPILGSDLTACGYLFSQMLGCNVRYFVDSSPQVACAALDDDVCWALKKPDFEANEVWRHTEEQARKLYDLIGEMGKLVDLLGINSYYGWYDKVRDVYEQLPLEKKDGMIVPEPVDLTAFHEMMQKIEAVVPQRVPLLLTEFGADSIPGFFASGDDLWTENYHAKVLRHMFAAAHEHPRIFGTYIFCFTDYADPSKPFNGFWNAYNLKGMVTYNRDKKLPFLAMQEEYTR